MHNSSVDLISLGRLSLMLLPPAVVVLVLMRWSVAPGQAALAIARMLVQLALVGFALAFIFESDTPWIVLFVLAVMVTVSAWIALRTVASRRRHLYSRALFAIAAGGGVTLLLVTQLVLDLEPWYQARYAIPLAGMIFANAMTSVSLAAERFQAEHERGEGYEAARRIALGAALIPITNAMLAVGLVSLPGMMTGQILSGIDPLIAVRYQIMVMCMIYGSSGIAAATFLVSIRSEARSELEPVELRPTGAPGGA